MTNIDMMRHGNCYALQLNGHADHAAEGEDIVCAGISAITYALAESLIQSDTVSVTEIKLEPGDVRIACRGAACDYFRMAQLGYALIQAQYPKNVLLRGDANFRNP